MIGGSPIGGENVGSFSIDNFVFGARGGGVGLSGGQGVGRYSFSLQGAGLGSSGSVLGWAVVNLTLPAGIGVSSGEMEREVQGTLNVDIGASGLGLGLPAIESDVLLRGVPDFFVTRSGASATITVRNRGGKEVRLFRADDYNLTFTEITTFANDTFTDTGLDPEKNYKYKLAFTVSITPPVNGQRSISKFTIT